MSGAASSSMTAGLKSLPQNSVNHRPTTALFSSIDMGRSLLVVSCLLLPEACRSGMSRLRRPRVLDLEQGALPAQTTRVAGELAGTADHPVAGDHDAHRVAADGRTDVPRVRPGPQAAAEVAVGGCLPVGHAGYQLPDPPVEFGALDLHGQLERGPPPAEVLTELARDVLESLVGAGTERRPVGPGPVPWEIQPGQSLFLPDDRHHSQACFEHRVHGARGSACCYLHVCFLPLPGMCSAGRRAGEA